MRKPESIARKLLAWYDAHGRKDLPWQHPRTPYRVWLSEVMLQQTQVATAAPYFLRFVHKFPSLRKLAAAQEDDVLAAWSGLGYYTRARNLHRAAQVCVERHRAALPCDFNALISLPGIGRSTAAAILAQAHGLRFAILDGNVKRVLARYHGVHGWPGTAGVAAQLWTFAELHTPSARVADYTQAIMDLGATVCTRARPRCTACPLAHSCMARRDALTAALPERKPARSKPERSTVMLVLSDAHGRILLERRPATGVWAQLWSLPEAGDVASARDRVAREHTRGRTLEFRQLAPFVHSFSHYKLGVTPLACAVDSTRLIADSPDRRWLHPKEAAQLGLPAPVRKLIANLEF